MGPDGRVEGLKFTFSHENTNITTNYRTTISKIDREPPKKISYPQRQRRSHIKMKIIGFGERKRFCSLIVKI